MGRVLRWVGRTLLVGLYVCFAAVGVWMIASGEGADRALGLATVLMFGPAGLLFLVLFRRRGGAALRIGLDTAVDPPQRGLQVPMRGTKWVVAMMVCLGMGAGSAILGLYADALADAGDSPFVLRLVGFGGAALFLFLGATPLMSLRHGLPRLVLTTDGMAMVGSGQPCSFPWTAVEKVGHWEVTVRNRGQRFVGVRVNDARAIRRPWYSRLLSTGSRSMSGWDLMFADQMFDVTAEQLATLVRGLHANPDLRRAVVSLPDGALSFDELITRTGGAPAPPF